MEEKKVKIGEKYKCIASPRYTCFKIGDTYEIKDEFEAELISLCRDCFTLDEESEDEKVRQELTTFLINFNNGYYSKPSEDKIESWIKWIDKKCKHNPTNEVKPKFKVGDWVRAISSGNIFKILSVNGGLYRVLCYDGVEANYPIEDVDYDLAYWTIKDAKDGDVIFYDSGWTCIFKNIHGIWYSSYCFITADGEFYTGYERHAVDAKLNGNANIATKEQRDLLFQKMHEAGYEWDAEKKELIEIEKKGQNNKVYIQKFNIGDTVCRQGWEDHTIEKIYNDGKFEPVYICKNEEGIESHISFSEQDEWKLKDENKYDKGYNDGFSAAKFNQCEKKAAFGEYDLAMIDNLVTDENCPLDSEYLSWLKSIKDRIQLQPKKELSKDDENMIECIIAAIKIGDYYTQDELNRMTSWLKSIKDRVQPKKEWSEKDETGWTNTMIMIKEVASHHYTKDSIKLVVDWLESIKNRIQQKQEWSKEDSERLLRIYQFIWANRKGDTDEIYQQEQDADWLMSIIPQQNQYDKGYNDGYSAAKYNQWKPTDKQMEDFRMLLDYNIGVFDYAKFMSADSLYEDLKKNLIDE